VSHFSVEWRECGVPECVGFSVSPRENEVSQLELISTVYVHFRNVRTTPSRTELTNGGETTSEMPSKRPLPTINYEVVTPVCILDCVLGT